ncbi:MAG: low temperature requirement protein A [Hamadaea sp.]|uniref:low temperature requirement protein A n=1 Tax=Hamadaea sp. TaxID=2024425 RepID=UPI001823125B|nr:low temperature requirement protein A [Hamadaea sp.]NUT18572.1 low temperature requirement protein A [Hamadaea sp.]
MTRRLRFGVAGDAEERHGSWLELFFDLIFVVAVAELANTLEHHPTVHGFVRYVALFLPVCWAWVGYTFFADRWQREDAPHKALMIIAMLMVAFLALAIPHAFTGDRGSIRFALSYSAVRLLLIILYARAWRTDPAARPLTGRYLLGFTIGLLLWLGSAGVSLPQRHWLWVAGFVVELATPLVSARAISRVAFHRSHIPERFGLFVIIVLGEAVALGVAGLGGSTLGAPTLVAAAVGFLGVGALWWHYFDCVDGTPLQRWLVSGQSYVYGHLVLFPAITAYGVGVLLASQEPPHEVAARWCLCGGAAAYFLVLAVIRWTVTRPSGDLRVWSRAAAGLALLGLAAVGSLPILAVDLIVLAVITGQLGAEHLLMRRASRPRTAGTSAATPHPDSARS